MPWFVYLIAIVSTPMLLFMAWTRWQAGRMKGETLKELPGGLRAADTSRALIIYAYSPSCGPCKSITPRVDALMNAGKNIVKLNVHEDLASARQMNIRATPTFILMRSGRIEDIRLGPQNIEKLTRFLDS